MAGISKGAAIGIDLGTTYSCVGYWKNSRVEIIANDQGNRTTPSYVAFTQKDCLVGDAARNQAALNPINTIFDAKRLIGRKFSDETAQGDIKLWPFKVVQGPNDRPRYSVSYKGENKHFTAEEISSMVLKRMKQTAETFIGTEVKDAVITVPAYFDQAQRQGTIDAGTIAGFHSLKIINEPTAAAIAYSPDNSNFSGTRNVLTFDLGGGTFDVSLLAIQTGKIEVKSIAGDTHLGGEDFDNRLVKYFIKEFKRKTSKDLSQNPKAIRRLRTACEKGKRVLTYATETTIDIDALHEGIDFSATLSRAKFEELNMDLFEKCIQKVENCLIDAQMKTDDIDEVVLVGGSSRILKVQQMLRKLFDNKELCASINPDEAVAYGAAVQAAMVSHEANVRAPNIVLVEVNPLSLGIRVNGEIMEVLIPKHTTIPASIVQNFTTSFDNQTAVTFRVYEGERGTTTENKLLGKFRLTDIQLAPRGVPKVEVRFDLQASGILKVSAKDTATGKQVSITIESGRLSGEEIQKMISEANKYKADDEKVKEKSEAMMDFERYALEMRHEIQVNPKYRFCAAKKRKAEDAIEKALEWLDSRVGLAEVSEYEEKKRKLMAKLNN